MTSPPCFFRSKLSSFSSSGRTAGSATSSNKDRDRNTLPLGNVAAAILPICSNCSSVSGPPSLPYSGSLQLAFDLRRHTKKICRFRREIFIRLPFPICGASHMVMWESSKPPPLSEVREILNEPFQFSVNNF